MGKQGFGKLVTDGEQGIERGHRFLEDHRHVNAPDLSRLAIGKGGDIPDTAVPFFQPDPAAVGVHLFEEMHDPPHGDGFARSGFSYNGQGLTFFDTEGNIVQYLDEAGKCRKTEGEIFDGEKGILSHSSGDDGLLLFKISFPLHDAVAHHHLAPGNNPCNVMVSASSRSRSASAPAAIRPFLFARP